MNMRPDHKECLKYTIEHHDDLDDETKELYDSIFDFIKEIKPFFVLDSIIEAAAKTPVGSPPTYNDEQLNLINYILSGITSEDHPMYAYHKPADKDEIKKYVNSHNRINLNWLDVSEITNMAYLFRRSHFNGDISLWHLDNVEIMESMFSYSFFDGDISKWRFPKAYTLWTMFDHSHFNGDISDWEFPNVTCMVGMFMDTDYRGDISRWKFPKVQDMKSMFSGSTFNGDISNWEFPEVEVMGGMFSRSTFNGDISKWKFPKVHDMSEMFAESCFNGDIADWEFPEVLTMFGMFRNSVFNGDISRWKFPKVNNMSYMFFGALLSGTSKLTGNGKKADKNAALTAVFKGYDFKNGIGNWKFPSVRYMDDIFRNSLFDGDISEWEIPEEYQCHAKAFSDMSIEHAPKCMRQKIRDYKRSLNTAKIGPL